MDFRILPFFFMVAAPFVEAKMGKYRFGDFAIRLKDLANMEGWKTLVIKALQII